MLVNPGTYHYRYRARGEDAEARPRESLPLKRRNNKRDARSCEPGAQRGLEKPWFQEYSRARTGEGEERRVRLTLWFSCAAFSSPSTLSRPRKHPARRERALLASAGSSRRRSDRRRHRGAWQKTLKNRRTKASRPSELIPFLIRRPIFLFGPKCLCPSIFFGTIFIHARL